MSYGMGPPKFEGDKVPKGYKTGQVQQFTPEQLQLFQQLFSHVGPDSFLSKLASGDQSQFAEMEAPALRQFGELQGNIASRFSGMGQGGRHSSGFQNTMNAAAGDFAQRLQSQRLGLQNQAVQDLIGMSNQLLNQRPYDRQLIKKAPQWWEAPLSAFAGGAGQGIGESVGSQFTGYAIPGLG